MTIPAPMPRMQLTAMSCVIVRAKRHATPLIKNMARPARSSAILLRATDSRPDNRINGMISTEGDRRKHLYFEIAHMREDLVQVTRYGRHGQPGQRHHGRNRPDGDDHGERHTAFSCLYLHNFKMLGERYLAVVSQVSYHCFGLEAYNLRSQPFNVHLRVLFVHIRVLFVRELRVGMLP